ncbi:MAG: hypothetical protein IJ403_02935 [Oscillospiraceae bacterium]|nr:hypothetical protein [Oscillospiraceae bacterium]
MQDNQVLSKSELIQKLQEISAAYKKTAAIQQKIKDFKPEDTYERTFPEPQSLSEDLNEKECDAWRLWLEVRCDPKYSDMSDEEEIGTLSYSYEISAKPKKPTEEGLDDKTKTKTGCMTIPTGILAGMSLIALFSAEDFFTVVFNLILIAVCVIVFLKGKRIKTTTLEANKAKYEQELKDYLDALAAYEQDKAAFVQKYTKWNKSQLAHIAEEKKIAKLLEADKAVAQEKIRVEEYVPAKAELDACNDLLAESDLPHTDIIIDLLKSGRADDLKEALNQLEGILYREKQLELQREQEQQRRREEEQRREDEERRYRQQREDEERYRREEDRRRKEAEDDARRQANQAADRAKREAENRCFHCANRRNCSLRFSHPQNCSAFRP